MKAEAARKRIEYAMEALGQRDIVSVERQLQHAYANLDGDMSELYPDSENGGGSDA